jgi:hypothetical protein
VNALHQSPEHEFEAAHGLPEALPASERILWQGSPRAQDVARQVMHVGAIAGYFGVLLAWRGISAFHDGASIGEALLSALWLLPLPLLALGLLGAMAWLVSRTSVYTITDRRVVLRIGVVLNVTFNLPFARIDAVGLRTHRNGSGDLSLLLGESDHIAYVHLWPHARPWHLRRTQPTLRCIPQVERVAALLSTAIAAQPAAQSALAPSPEAGAPASIRAAAVRDVREPITA